jgi:hypothetical protein
MPTRCANWPEALAAYIDRKRNEPFAWGVNDCCLFGADWIQLCTGLDPAATLRGTYDRALSGVRVLEKHGGLIGTIETHMEPLGFKPIGQGFAARGDIAVRDCGNGDTMAILIGSSIAYVGKDGLLFAELNDGVETRFWKI